MEINLRYYDPFNEEMVYSSEFPAMSNFFISYEKRVAAGNEPILMVSTGLKDKNGKEAWEGDKVKWIAYGPFSYEYPEEGRREYEGIGTVIYSTKNACFYIEGEEEIHPLCADFGEEEIEFEVIGNAWEAN